jgi:hypothetical protein
MSQRVQVNFDDGAVEVIQRLGKATGSDAAEVIRDALSLYDWARQQYEEGKKVASITKNGMGVMEVILPFKSAQK